MIDPMHDDPTRVQLPAQVTSARVVVILPGDIGLNAAIAPIEVLVQEGFNVFSLPAAADLTAAQLHSIFGSRIFLGVHDIADTEQARRLIDEQAGFASHLNAFEAEAMLGRVRLASAQDAASAARLARLGLPVEAMVAPVMLKAAVAAVETPTLPFALPPRNRVALAASTHPGEETAVLEGFASARTASP